MATNGPQDVPAPFLRVRLLLQMVTISQPRNLDTAVRASLAWSLRPFALHRAYPTRNPFPISDSGLVKRPLPTIIPPARLSVAAVAHIIELLHLRRFPSLARHQSACPLFLAPFPSPCLYPSQVPCTILSDTDGFPRHSSSHPVTPTNPVPVRRRTCLRHQQHQRHTTGALDRA